VPTFRALESKPEYAELVSEWQNMLGYQIPVLPPFEQYWRELPEVFDWLYHSIEKGAPAAIPDLEKESDRAWQPPAMAQAWHARTPIEIIRYAAASRLCINLAYHGSERLIEPYALRKTQDGNLVLFAAKHVAGELRSYRIDKIQDVKVTKTPFQPRYAIELATAGSLSSPPSTFNSSSMEGGRDK
jgi:hypothetical protein